MKEDYLWDKTGADPEIEMLENALQAFRYQETAPPALSIEVLPFKKETPRKTLRFAFAMAACLMFGVLALGVWFQVLRNNLEADQPLAEINSSSNNSVLPEIKPADQYEPAKNSDESSVKQPENSKQSFERKIVRNRRALPSEIRRKETKAPPVNATKPVVVQLTEEEQYAYNQLMTALSITSSKLKLVKEKVEGTDE